MHYPQINMNCGIFGLVIWGIRYHLLEDGTTYENTMFHLWMLRRGETGQITGGAETTIMAVSTQPGKL